MCSIGRPTSRGMRLKRSVTEGVKRRTCSCSSRNNVPMLVERSRLSTSLLRSTSSWIFVWYSVLTVWSSSLTLWSSSFVLWSSSFDESSSSFVACSSSFDVSSSSIVACRFSFVYCSSCCRSARRCSASRLTEVVGALGSPGFGEGRSKMTSRSVRRPRGSVTGRTRTVTDWSSSPSFIGTSEYATSLPCRAALCVARLTMEATCFGSSVRTLRLALPGRRRRSDAAAPNVCTSSCCSVTRSAGGANSSSIVW